MPVGGTSVLGSMLATWRAKPRTSVNRLADDTWLAGTVAHAKASFVVIVVALCASIKEMKSRSRRACSRYVYPSPWRMHTYRSSAERRSVIARLPATAGSMSGAYRYRPWRRSASCRGSCAAAAGRSPTRSRRTEEAQWLGYAEKDGPLGVRHPECQHVRARPWRLS